MSVIVEINGKAVELSGKGSCQSMRDRLGFAIDAISIELNADAKTLSFTEVNVARNGVKDEIVHHFDKIEGATEYDQAVYIYAYNTTTGQRTRLIFKKA